MGFDRAEFERLAAAEGRDVIQELRNGIAVRLGIETANEVVITLTSEHIILSHPDDKLKPKLQWIMNALNPRPGG